MFYLQDLESNFFGNGCFRLGLRWRNCSFNFIFFFTTISEEEKRFDSIVHLSLTKDGNAQNTIGNGRIDSNSKNKVRMIDQTMNMF